MKNLTLQEQYNLIKEGRGAKDVFLKHAKQLFPNYIPNHFGFDNTVTILKQKSILNENFVGLTPLMDEPKSKPSFETAFANFLAEEAKVEEKKPTKEVTDKETAGYDYKDPKVVDNMNFEEFLRGYYAEMKDPKNADKTEAQLKEMVAKNLAKDESFYVKNAAFGVKGIGYEEPKEQKELKGEYASGGMEKVKVKEGKLSLMDMLNEFDDKSMKAYGDAVKKSYGAEDKEVETKKVAKKKVKKESVDSKLAEIDKQGKLVTMEAQMDALDELIASKQQRVEMVNEDDDLSELADKKKIKAMQKEIKDLEKRRAKMDKVYEKMCGKAYVKQEIVDEAASEEIED
jgi:hypothetical protein